MSDDLLTSLRMLYGRPQTGSATARDASQTKRAFDKNDIHDLIPNRLKLNGFPAGFSEKLNTLKFPPAVLPATSPPFTERSTNRNGSGYPAALSSIETPATTLEPALVVFCDFETRNVGGCDLTKAGAWRYAADPATEILCFGYRTGATDYFVGSDSPFTRSARRPGGQPRCDVRLLRRLRGGRVGQGHG